ncbi:hypothetical protein L1D44_04840 [Shewanella sp. Isolate13]|uniref:hypothetical protein n=1 Tax=Shewanella sp. Isolate13 TaxID=2908531 RepID=UPI001EFEDAC2|nr:hypothetical protein [Shewanella sp. Isolate13]MCG9729170.1 hypothetical protein [Shewanella sp. Isolate13]
MATIFTGILAISAVIYSQWRFDRRLENQHQNYLAIKAEEPALEKKEEIIELATIVSEYLIEHEKIYEAAKEELAHARYAQFNELRGELQTKIIKCSSKVDKIDLKLKFPFHL